MSMITLLLMLGLIWIILKIMIMFVEIPFRIIGWILRLPISAIFWGFLILAILVLL